MTRTLINRRDAFHNEALFNLEITDRRGTRNITAYAKCIDGKAFINQQSGMLKSHYTQADRDLSARLISEAPVKNGDTVTLDGIDYKVKVNGNYCDAAQLIKV
jgi:septal ring-binding cell division protein DamX